MIEHWMTTGLLGANASFQRAAREYAEEYAALAVAAERERCAKGVRNIGADHFSRQHGRAEDPRVTAAAIARWIEGRGA